MTHTSSFDQDTTHTILSSRRRRFLLYHFLENDHANLTEIALQIAAWEEDTSIKDVSEDLHQRVKIALVHNHLPRLADHGIIEYDTRSGDIVVRDGFAEFRPILAHFQENDSYQLKNSENGIPHLK